MRVLKNIILLKTLLLFVGCNSNDNRILLNGNYYFESKTKVKDSVILKSYHTNGMIKKKISFLKGKKHGPYVELDSSGNILISSMYKSNVLDGQRNYFNSKGEVTHENNYLNGKRSGYQITFDEKGDTSGFNFCYKDSILYSVSRNANSVEEQILPYVKLEKDSVSRKDTLAVGYGLPIDGKLINGKELYLYIGIDSFKPPPAILEMAIDSIPLNTDGFRYTGMIIHDKGDLMLYGYIGNRRINKYKNYQVFRRRFYSK